jgi:hypothetical protein
MFDRLPHMDTSYIYIHYVIFNLINAKHYCNDMYKLYIWFRLN